MGDVADMVMDGVICEGCGTAMIVEDYDDLPGHPVLCMVCENDQLDSMQQDDYEEDCSPV